MKNIVQFNSFSINEADTSNIPDTSSARVFNASLKKLISEHIGQKIKVEIVNSYKFPNCWVRIYPERGSEFDNDFRLQVFDACNATRDGLGNPKDVSYGNIQRNSIAAKVNEWVKLFNDLK